MPYLTEWPVTSISTPYACMRHAKTYCAWDTLIALTKTKGAGTVRLSTARDAAGVPGGPHSLYAGGHGRLALRHADRLTGSSLSGNPRGSTSRTHPRSHAHPREPSQLWHCVRAWRALSERKAPTGGLIRPDAAARPGLQAALRGARRQERAQRGQRLVGQRRDDVAARVPDHQRLHEHARQLQRPLRAPGAGRRSARCPNRTLSYTYAVSL
jgi:hypothetical protein